MGTVISRLESQGVPRAVGEGWWGGGRGGARGRRAYTLRAVVSGRVSLSLCCLVQSSRGLIGNSQYKLEQQIVQCSVTGTKFLVLVGEGVSSGKCWGVYAEDEPHTVCVLALCLIEASSNGHNAMKHAAPIVGT